MTMERILKNARIVLKDEMIEGSVLIRDGRIAAIEAGSLACAGEDMDGDLLLPGLVELHTDHIEKHMKPRPGVLWNPMTALLAHDAQLCSAGITTVLDAVRIGNAEHRDDDDVMAVATAEQILACRDNDVLRADHLIHLRCEISAPNVRQLFERLADHSLIRLVSLMDHTPGQRQFTNIDKWRQYYGGKSGKSGAEIEELIVRMRANAEENSYRNRRSLAAGCVARGHTLASHDDATEEHVEEAIELGMTIAEFPTTHEAAAAASAKGMRIVAGSPNVVRGGSHSGNVSAVDLARDGHLDALSSDYVPISLLHSAFLLHEQVLENLPAAVRKVSSTPASMIGLSDRGEIAEGLRADIIQVSDRHDAPVVRQVWREGARVA
ncbi:MAG: alpha-D-ribose 1-methylphosphonate 5-triphosphate diphosphatase [Alphaproteobacteria bacterium]|nr:alpha-D-ribose 1-methylphosphonate 5-triphosphate diphosphatase [Alphaproteobacteria bacterium]